MTTKAIEAGARALYRRWDTYPAYAVRQMNDLLAADLAKACIEAAIASGELVPASAVAAERERCANVAEDFTTSNSGNYCDSCHDVTFSSYAAAAAIRALKPASGEKD